MLRGYSEATRARYHDALRAIVERFAALAWDLSARPGRVCRAHGDFHPLNVLFDDDTGLRVV
ncbi:MAG: phosphotransferase [bacterium]